MGSREYWNAKDGHYLGPAHDAVPIRIDPNNPLDYGKPELGVDGERQRVSFDLIHRLNQLRTEEFPHDATLEARIKSYELAFRMQASVPEALNFQSETEATHEMYGITKRRRVISECKCWRRDDW